MNPGRNPRGVDGLIVWVAQGFGAGWSPVAPGTAGTVVGLLWAVALIQSGHLLIYGFVSAVVVGISVYFCGRAERVLGAKDPGSVVLDEIAAVPICFIGMLWERSSDWRFDSGWFLTTRGLIWLGVGFALFRLFDIWKPWPVRQSQRLPGGWGVVIDDVLAAGYTALVIKWMALIFP